jgi:hypothetical protein
VEVLDRNYFVNGNFNNTYRSAPSIDISTFTRFGRIVFYGLAHGTTITQARHQRSQNMSVAFQGKSYNRHDTACIFLHCPARLIERWQLRD